MFSKPYFAECFVAPKTKTEDEKEQEHRAYVQRMEDISKLPLVQQGWLNWPLRLYNGFWFPEIILSGVLSLRLHFVPTLSDIFLITYPKSGTTWLKALAFSVITRHPQSLLSRHPQHCSPQLEVLFSSPFVPNLDVLPSPRLLSTHIPYSILPESVRDSPCRIIYLCREPKDTLVSTYHFIDGMKPKIDDAQPMSFVDSLDLFCKGQSIYGPLWEHQLEYWQESKRSPDKVLFLKYEDMMDDPHDSVRRLAYFMGKPFSPEEERAGMVEEIVNLCSFKNLSELEVNKVGVWVRQNGGIVTNSSFFRKGKVGDWSEHLTTDMAERLDAITRDRLHETGLIHLPQLD